MTSPLFIIDVGGSAAHWKITVSSPANLCLQDCDESGLEAT